MNYKKITAALLIAAMTVPFGACSKEAEETEQTTAATTQAAVPSETTPAVTEAVETQPVATQSLSPDALSILRILWQSILLPVFRQWIPAM